MAARARLDAELVRRGLARSREQAREFIDGGLVKGLESDDRARTFLTNIVELCQSLNLEIIAEMIETESLAKALQGLGVQYGQGWLFGKPTPRPEGMQRASGRVAARRRHVIGQLAVTACPGRRPQRAAVVEATGNRSSGIERNGQLQQHDDDQRGSHDRELAERGMQFLMQAQTQELLAGEGGRRLP